MKKLFWIAVPVLLLIFVSVYLFTATPRSAGTATLEIRCAGKAPKELIIGWPVGGANFWAHADTVTLDDDGRAVLEVPAESCGLTLIRVPGGIARVITFPGSRTEVGITGSGFEFTGSQAEGHRFFNGLQRRLILDVENPFAADTSPAAICSGVRAQREAELAQLASLRKEGKVTPAFHDFAAEDIRYYHAANLADAFCFHYNQTRLARQRKERDSVLAPEWADAWERSFREMPLNAPSAIRTGYFKFYAALYYEWFLGEFRGMRKTPEQAASAGGDKRHPAIYRIIGDHFSGDVAAYLQAQYIYNSARRQLNERSLVDLFEKFNAQYPRNPYTPFIRPEIDAIVDYHHRLESDTLSDTRFHAGYQRLQSLEELLNGLKGTAWYIDIWATWCWTKRASGRCTCPSTGTRRMPAGKSSSGITSCPARTCAPPTGCAPICLPAWARMARFPSPGTCWSTKAARSFMRTQAGREIPCRSGGNWQRRLFSDAASAGSR